jgi:hypothetical protein
MSPRHVPTTDAAGPGKARPAGCAPAAARRPLRKGRKPGAGRARRKKSFPREQSDESCRPTPESSAGSPAQTGGAPGAVAGIRAAVPAAAGDCVRRSAVPGGIGRRTLCREIQRRQAVRADFAARLRRRGCLGAPGRKACLATRRCPALRNWMQCVLNVPPCPIVAMLTMVVLGYVVHCLTRWSWHRAGRKSSSTAARGACGLYGLCRNVRQRRRRQQLVVCRRKATASNLSFSGVLRQLRRAGSMGRAPACRMRGIRAPGEVTGAGCRLRGFVECAVARRPRRRHA